MGDLTVIHSHPNSLLKINLQQRMQNPGEQAGDVDSDSASPAEGTKRFYLRPWPDSSLIQQSHLRGKEMATWTINDEVTMATMIRRGADHLVTDYPALAKQVVEQQESFEFHLIIFVRSGIVTGARSSQLSCLQNV